jgi:hypothetical protein
MKKKLITILAGTAILIFSCGNKYSDEKAVASLDRKISSIELKEAENSEEYETADTTLAPRQNQQQPAPDLNKSVAKKVDWDKKIIKTATLNLEAKAYNEYNSSLREIVKQTGGYIAQEEQTQNDYKIENSVTIKVPVDQFDNAVSLVTAGVEKINEKKITAQDVTAEVVDTKSRLGAKKQVRLRYLDLLKQARNMEEILHVQSEINDIQEEIESATGRIEYLTHSASFSTIHLTFYQVLNASAKDSEQPSFGTKLSNAFRNGWNWIGEVLIGFISIWPLLLMIFFAFIVYRKTKNIKTKQA